MKHVFTTPTQVTTGYFFQNEASGHLQEILRLAVLDRLDQAAQLMHFTCPVTSAMAVAIAHVLSGKRRACSLSYAEKKVLCSFLSPEQVSVSVADACLDDSFSVVDVRLLTEEIFFNEPALAIHCLQQTIALDKVHNLMYCRGEDVFEIFQVSWLLLGPRRMREFLTYVRSTHSDIYAQAINNVYAVREDYLSSKH